MRMIRSSDHRWKLVRHHLANGLNELYDLKNDPHEQKNLYNSADAREKRDELQAKLTEWQKSIDDPILSNPLNTPSVGGSVDVR
jgi:arylsulfatase A-like enzyme